MRAWVDVFDAAGNRIGVALPIKHANIKQNLDGAGAFTLNFVGGDNRVRDWLAVGYEIRIFYWVDDGITDEAIELGRGRVVRMRIRESSGGREWTVNGVSELDDLARRSVLQGLKYENMPIVDVVSDIVDDANWTVHCDTSGNVTCRFDGVSRLKALLKLAEQTGYHLREEGGRVLRFGTLGTPSAVRLYGGGSSAAWAQSGTDDVAAVQRIVVDEQIGDVVNWVMPLGGGSGDTALTLEHSTRTSPYTIETVTLPDGRTGYYLRDTGSIATHGQVQRVVKFQSISPLANDDANIERAANALYDAASAYLQRAAQKRISYDVTITRPRSVVIRPGDRVRLTYKGMAETRDGYLVDIDVNEELWVLKADISAGLEGLTYSLALSTVDAIERDAVETVVGALEEVEVQRTAIQAYPVARGFVYVRQMDSTHAADIPIRITDVTLSLIRATVQISTRPFRANVTGAASGGGATSAAGGDHAHRVFAITSFSGFPATNTRPFLGRNAAGGAYHHLKLDTALNQDLWTESSSGNHTHTLPAHTHAMQYGIYTDTITPDTVRVAINGVDLTSALGGAWATGGGSATFEIDITDALRDAVGGLRQAHTVTVTCDSGRGEIEAVIETIEVIQTLTVL